MLFKKQIVSVLVGAAMLGVSFIPHSLGSLTVYADEMLDNNSFSNGECLPWFIEENPVGTTGIGVENGELVLDIKDGGYEPSSLILFQRPVNIVKGHTYTVKFKVRATQDCKINPRLTKGELPYTNYWIDSPVIELKANEQLSFEGSFTMTYESDRKTSFKIWLGGEYAANAPYKIAFDDFSLWDDQYQKVVTPEPEVVEIPDVKVNQLGYFENGPKKAIVVCNSSTPVKWYLKDSKGKVVKSGKTEVYGFDEASGDNIHRIDFSSYTKKGKNYTLCVDGATESFPFDINNQIYDKLKYDALSYFYHARSGIDITMPYAGREDLTRPAGHVNEVAVSADNSVSYAIYSEGGWYDAGDHGKNAVNAGISVWTLQNEYERTKYIKGSDSKALSDGKMNIPENNNKIPDILDETRWEVEMLMKMQVKDGNPKAGMVVHEVWDEDWSCLGTPPHEDVIKRVFVAPSTAATLDVAAVTAQSARLWKNYDKKYSEKCLAAAEKAWKAAIENPKEYIYYPYGDGSNTDEFYFAACELFITTGKSEYLDFMKKSVFYLKLFDLEPGQTTYSYQWSDVAGLGTLSLSIVPNKLPKKDLKTVKSNIIDFADKWLNILNDTGSLVPLTEYRWGSNSDVLNNAMLMAYAYDFTQDKKFLDGVIESMDYILGKNALAQSYISGYGEKAMQNPSHRFFANSMFEDLPTPPDGVLSGGANQFVQDGWAQAAGLTGKPGQRCYVDHIQSYSTNEVAINWNSPLSWITAFLDEKADNQKGCINLW